MPPLHPLITTVVLLFGRMLVAGGLVALAALVSRRR